MSEIELAAAKIELLNDLVKIGIPALIGMITGVVIGTIPYFIEKQKSEYKAKQDSIFYRREKISELVNALSIFSGTTHKHITLVRNLMSNDTRSSVTDDEYEELLKIANESSLEFLSNEFQLKKARAISGLLGSQVLSDLIESYDSTARTTMNYIVDKNGDSMPDNDEQLNAFRAAEKEVLRKLDLLMKKEE